MMRVVDKISFIKLLSLNEMQIFLIWNKILIADN